MPLYFQLLHFSNFNKIDIFVRYVAQLQVLFFFYLLKIEEFTGLPHYLQTAINAINLFCSWVVVVGFFFKNANEMLIAFPRARWYWSKAIFRSAYFYLTRFTMFFGWWVFFSLYMHWMQRIVHLRKHIYDYIDIFPRPSTWKRMTR